MIRSIIDHLQFLYDTFKMNRFDQDLPPSKK
jgi:hypothetical protein